MSGEIYNSSFMKFNGRKIVQVPTELHWTDHFGTFKARFGIGRMKYLVEPGLYAVGTPDEESEVLLSANYKMSFDALRGELFDRSFWILVLDTKGINVWCAAGKGTFSTEEVINRIKAVSLDEVVSHKRLICPQLGAVGVSAHEVGEKTSFKIIYGPIRANDLLEFIDNGRKATPQMRRVTFGVSGRLALVPMEFFGWIKPAVITLVILLLLAGLAKNGFSLANIFSTGVSAVILFIIAYAIGTIAVPILLPWLPGRMFAAKGALLGFVFWLILFVFHLLSGRWFINIFEAAAWALLMPAIASFMAMNFTGSTTFTSFSGVRKEMTRVVPIQLASAIIGLVIWLGSHFII